MAIDRASHGQLIVGAGKGDCFRACMSVLLGVPNGDHLPNVHADGWWQRWQDFLGEIGLAIGHDHAKGAIWRQSPWIASAPSKNYEGVTHAIVMHEGGIVLFDPSPLQRYEEGARLIGQDVVLGGTWLEVADGEKLANFAAWRAGIVGAR